MNEKEESTAEELAEEIQNALEETVSKEVSDSEPEGNETEETAQETDHKKKNRIIIGVIILVIAIACIIGFMSCSNNKKETEPVATQAETEITPPVITLMGEDTVIVGANTEIVLQDIVKSVESEVGIESVEVTVESAVFDDKTVDSAELKDKVAIEDIKDGQEKDGVPAKSLTFKEEGTYTINISAVDTEGGETVMPVTFEVGGELLSYVTGLRDWTVEQGARDIDWMDGVTWDREHISSVTADASKVKLDTVGSYDLVYTIKGKINNEEITITKKVEVKVINKETAQKEADKGKQVTTTGNEVKKDSSGSVPSGVASSNNSDSATTKPAQGSSNSGDNQSNPQPSNPQPSNPQPSNPQPSNSQPSEPSKPAHKHTWVHVEAKTHQEDQGYDEQYIISEAVPSQWVSTGVVDHYVCQNCFYDTTDVNALSSHITNNFDNGCTSNYNYEEDTGYWTEAKPAQYGTRHVEKWVTVTDEPAYDYCSGCGARK